MSESSSESQEQDQKSGGSEESNGPGISDDQLPEDLRPTDDNPLAQPPDQDDEGESGFNPMKNEET